ncbi:MAG: amidohydrolase family protein [Bacteroidales bacterium]|jgi:cytosine/adenosine deaminase-related metal-dependent hydrolase
MRKISADYIFPVSSPPLKKGIIITDGNGRILDLIESSAIDYNLQDVEFYDGIICPGFVNTHCHLELSFMLNKIKQNLGLINFIVEIEKLKKAKKEIILLAAVEAEKQMLKNGIVAVGDISNTNISFKIKNNSNIYFHTFIEVYSFDENKADRIFDNAFGLNKEIKSSSIVLHTPFTVSNKLIKRVFDFALKNNSLQTIHNQESQAENEMFLTGSGAIFEQHKIWGNDVSKWVATGKSSLQSMLPLIPKELKTLFVHNTFTKKEDIDFVNEYFKNIWWSFCPNANIFIENKLPDFKLFSAFDDRITLGTDSLASNFQLSILEEMKTITLKSNSKISLEKLIKWGTLNGAKFLNVNSKFGSFEKGKNPGINLITDVDVNSMNLTKNSSIKVIV